MKNFKQWICYNESNNTNSSMDSMILYDKLKKLFDPVYNISRPSGHFLNNIEMMFNKNTSYSDIKNIIKNANWYISKINNGQIRDLNFNDNEIISLEIKPINGNNTIDMPKILYHISPSINDKDILKNGLKGSIGGKKGILHPKRIYLSKNINVLMTFIKELNYSIDKNEWTIWEIDTDKINTDQLFIDETVNQSFSNPQAVYIQNIDIPKSALKINKHINLDD